jgi:hypothetical protein
MIEVAVIIDKDGAPLHWRGTTDSSGGYIPDSRPFWDVIWSLRNEIAGIAHTHPWSGNPCPSPTDLSTFEAIELGLGKRLVWPIVTMDRYGFFGWTKPPEGPGYYGGGYRPGSFGQSTPWLETVLELRRRSQQGG